MKKLIILIFMLVCKLSYAQKELLSFDEHNKYIFYQVADMPGLSIDTLRSRGSGYLKTLSPKVKLLTSTSNINGEGKFYTYGGVSLLKHESGTISYLFNIEFKDQKYRFWLTGFTFNPYIRDRYGNFVPKPGIDLPLETASIKLEKRELDNYLSETGTFCKQFNERLRSFMVNAPKKEKNTNKLVIDKW